MKDFKLVRRPLIMLLLFIQLSQCCCNYSSEKFKNASGKTDTIVIVHEECTECTDARIIKGNITFPKQVNPDNLYSAGKEIFLAGQSPYDGAAIGEEIYRYNIEAIGYFTTIDTANAWGEVAVFCITNWKKLSKRDTISR